MACANYQQLPFGITCAGAVVGAGAGAGQSACRLAGLPIIAGTKLETPAGVGKELCSASRSPWIDVFHLCLPFDLSRLHFSRLSAQLH